MKKVCLLTALILSSSLYAITPEEIVDAYHKSYYYEGIENFADAIEVLQPVYREFPTTYTINLRLGWLYYLKKNYANSLEHYDKARRIAPASLEAKLGHLLPLLARESYKQVEQEAFQILNVDYYNYYGNLRLALALRMQQKFASAAKIALRMLEIYPIDVSFLIEYALIKHGQGDVEAAIKLFYDVLILDPENVTATAYLQTPIP